MTEQQFRAILASVGMYPNDRIFADLWEVAKLVREQCTAGLRDQFAGQAMQGILSNPDMIESVVKNERSNSLLADVYARVAYCQADAMIEARNRK